MLLQFPKIGISSNKKKGLLTIFIRSLLMKNSGKTEISKKPLAQLEIEEYRPQFPHIYESE